ncbi:MAG: STAS/SEC14 domain-containing protein, partial [Nitrospirales bacterium]
MHLSGKLTGGDIENYKNLLDGKLSNHGQLSVVVDFTGLSDMNADALVEGTKADLDLLSHVDQFTRFAFISDKEWRQGSMNIRESMDGVALSQCGSY